MNLARASVRRPVFASMLTLMVVVLGLTALSRLQIDLLPAIELPTVTVRAQFDGANPVVMEQQVTQIMEEIVATVPGVEEMNSTSYEGNSSIKVRFGWGTPIDSVAVDVRATLEDEISELPDDIIGPRVSKFDIDTYPVVILGVSSALDPVELTEIVENQIRFRLARVPGVAQIDPWGGFNREVRVEIDPGKIDALGLSLDDVLEAIRDANVDRPAGKIADGHYELTLRTPAEFTSLEQIADTVIARNGGAVVTLGQIANIVDGYEKLSRIVRVNGEPGLRVAIRKQPAANTVDVAARVLEEVAELQKDFPQVNIVPVTNQGNFIQRSIANVSQSVLYGGSLAIVLLLLFLRSLRSTLVISLSIPISVIATFALLYFSGFTLNLMTLGGLALGVGMMVDSSVVVLENIFRRQQEHGETARQAAVRGTREVAAAVLAGTITTLVIFLPLIFVQGVAGELFKELAYVMMFSLACALLVALGLLPMLASKLLSRHGNQAPQATQSALADAYHDLLHWALRHRLLTAVVLIAIFVGSLFLAPYIGTEFLPPSDEGQVRITGEMEEGVRLDLLDEQSRLLEEAVYPLVPEAVSAVVNVTSSGTRGSTKSTSRITLTLTPAAERERSNKDIARDLRRKLAGTIPGMKIRTRAPTGQFLLERILKTPDGITVEVRGFDLATLRLLSSRAAEAVEQVQGVTDVETTREKGIPQQELIVDRAKAADLGLSARDILSAVETAIAGSRAGDYRVDGVAYRILLQLQDAERRSLDEILNLTIRTPDGENVALRNLVSTKRSIGPVSIERKDRQRLITITANVAGRDQGSVAKDIQDRLRDIPRPPGYDMIVSGSYQEQQKAFSDLLTALLLSLLLVYMVLAAQYESLRDPLVVMLSVPVAAIGVLLTLFLTDTTMNLQSAIGCIMLGGIVVNNAILLVDQAGRLQRDGMDINTALAEAGRRRLRPILMTTLTTVLALVPLSLGIGEGADAQAPLARVVIGGLAASTIVTLLLVPVVYSLMHGRRDSAESVDSPTSIGEPPTTAEAR